MSDPTTINGADYQIGQLDARRQLHVGRRLMPVMAPIAAMLQTAQSGEVSDPMAALMPIANAISRMEDDEMDYIISHCLSVVQRQNTKHGGGWGPVVASNGRLMFDDIKLVHMLQIVAAVIKENLGPFFSDLGSLTALFGEATA